MPDEQEIFVAALPLTAKELTLVSLQYPGTGWTGIIERAKAAHKAYILKIKAEREQNEALKTIDN